ncbi:hypothetical protein Cni_G17362 [Canna indica]|uniref:Reverse transcriptase zinc-binding domain-containing protein n=1 Tax=Canna indica TaxID=4628 RepID=A0AAQ3QF13_9LILI|nr:hypothetical protein Cni_G17362 [Canna indica]
MNYKGKDLSWFGKAIAKNMCELKEGLRMAIGDGKLIRIWEDSWLSAIPFEKWPTFLDVEGLSKMQKVCELMKGRKWNQEALENYFGRELISLINDIDINTGECSDRWVWTPALNGKLSTKNAYVFVKRRRLSSKDTIDWSRVWRLKFPERVKMFLWKLLWNRLPTLKWFGKFSGEEVEKYSVCEGEDDT